MFQAALMHPCDLRLFEVNESSLMLMRFALTSTLEMQVKTLTTRSLFPRAFREACIPMAHFATFIAVPHVYLRAVPLQSERQRGCFLVGLAMVLTAQQHRERRTMQKYGRNAANQFVRVAAFRACDYTPAGELNQFQCETDVFAFETARWEDGTGYKVRFLNRPRATVPAEQLAVEAVGNVVTQDGNQTRVQLSVVDEGLHTRFDAIDIRLNRALESAEPPPSQAGDLQVMARLQKLCKVGRMNSLLKEHDIHYEVGLKVADKAALLVQKLPRDRLLEILANPQLTATPKSAPSSSRSSASASVSVARGKKRSAPTSGARNMSLTELLPAADHGGALAAPSDAHSQQADGGSARSASQAEPHEARDSELQQAERAAPNAKSVSRTAADSEDDAAVPPRKTRRVKECRMGLPTQAGIDAIFNVASSSQQASCTF